MNADNFFLANFDFFNQSRFDFFNQSRKEKKHEKLEKNFKQLLKRGVR